MSEPSTTPQLDPATIAQLTELESIRPGVMAELSRRFLAQAEELIGALSAASDDAYPAIRADAHKLKGSCLSLGAAELAAEVEDRARAGQATAAFRARLGSTLDALRPALSALS